MGWKNIYRGKTFSLFKPCYSYKASGLGIVLDYEGLGSSIMSINIYQKKLWVNKDIDKTVIIFSSVKKAKGEI